MDDFLETAKPIAAKKEFNVEELSQRYDRMLTIQGEHHQYLDSHPEVKQLLADFTTAILVKKPNDVFEFSRQYFSKVLPDEEAADMARRPLVIAGPSGVGKGTLIARLMKEMPDAFGFSVSHTTRRPRPGEDNGVHYHFTDIEKMQREIDDGAFIEHANVHGNLYGTSLKAVQDVQQQGKVCILDIDIQGVLKVKETELNPVYIFIAPPSIATLEARLRGRGTETEETMATRLGNAKGEMAYMKVDGFFNSIIVNDDLDDAYAQLRDKLFEYYADCLK